MDQPVLNEAPKKNNTTLIVGLIVVAIIAVGVLWSFGYLQKSPTEKNPAEKLTIGDNVSDWTKDLGGKVYLSLLPKNNAKNGIQLFVSDLSLPERKPQPVFISNDNSLNISQHISPDGLWGVYSNFKKGESLAQIYKLDLKTGEKQQITQSQSLFKRGAEWSPDGQQIAFMAETANETTKTIASDLKKWSVFVTDLQGKEKLISSNAAYPQWLPDSQQLIVSKEDGLYLCHIVEAKCKRVLDLSFYGRISLGMKVDLSRDGKMIAYSNHEAGEIILIKIFSLDPLQAGVFHVIKTTAYWPVFSEDGKYLIAEEIDRVVLDEQTKPRLVVYKLDTLEKATLLSLDDFRQNAMFVTDWRY